MLFLNVVEGPPDDTSGYTADNKLQKCNKEDPKTQGQATQKSCGHRTSTKKGMRSEGAATRLLMYRKALHGSALQPAAGCGLGVARYGDRFRRLEPIIQMR